MFWRRKQAPQGDIAGAGLADWWRSRFTEEQRLYIAATYQPMGNTQERRLVEGEPHPQDPGQLLLGLSSWFRAPADRPIERVLLTDAVSFSAPDSFTRHLIYGALMVNWYRDRDTDPVALPTAVGYAWEQVRMSAQAARAWQREHGRELPSHQGYEQLAIIAEKEHRYGDAVAIAQQAQADGWAGDWAKRIDRCSGKLARRRG